MNPKNGEIYAMASSRPFDLNNPSNAIDNYYSKKEQAKMDSETKSEVLLELWQNYCISTPYEPGSTAKIFTIAAGLEEDKIKGNETYNCDGVEVVNGVRIHCHNRSGHGLVNVTESLMVSCNDALMKIAKTEGKEVFGKYQKIFGIGEATGIDLPNEETCINLYYKPDKMSDVDLATNSFGQNFYTTVVQMAGAYASVVNGGNYYEPHLVKQVLDSDGNVVETINKKLVRKTISASTSNFIKKALLRTCEDGSGKKASIAGYQIGGKTGTAEKNKQGATGKDETYVVSFMSVAPAMDPEVLVYVTVDEPNIKKQSDSSQATNISKSVMGQIFPYLNIYPTETTTKNEN
ncbi:Cell division protein FtsI [Lachnospiraceae bacterium TWA4]|nr:Cell division protein FtsI [Lachnospiraceae bacterium TWA4]